MFVVYLTLFLSASAGPAAVFESVSESKSLWV